MTHASDTLKKLMIKAVRQRDTSAQEVAHQILSLTLYCSSFQNYIALHSKLSQHHTKYTYETMQITIAAHYHRPSWFRESFVTGSLKNISKEKCEVVAAFNVKGTTLHSLLHLPIRGKNCAELKGHSLCKLQKDMNDTEYLIIDEYSVIGQKMLGWNDKRFKQPSGQSTLPFGGINVILAGDIAQLPPITDEVFYHRKPNGQLATEGFLRISQI